MTKERWASLWHQLDEIKKFPATTVLELGPGLGLLQIIARRYGIAICTADLDPVLGPDVVASATELPFPDQSFEVCCAFQMLEHLPYPEALRAFSEMVRVSSLGVVVSLPDSREVWRFDVRLPKIGNVVWHVPLFWRRPVELPFLGEHYWEVNSLGYPLQRVAADLAELCPLIRTYRVPENPYHRFFVFRKPAS